jgi:hypothetical protein
LDPTNYATVWGITNWNISNFDDKANITDLEYRTNNSGIWMPMPGQTNGISTLTINTTSFTNGPFNINIRAINSVNLTNYLTFTNINYKGTIITTVTNPLPNTWLSNTSVIISGSNYLDYGNLTYAGWKTNSATIFNTSFTSSDLTNWSIALTLENNSTNIFTILISNNIGGYDLHTITNFIDTTAPFIAITNIANNTTTNDSIIYIGTNSDSFAQITGFWYSTNGAISWTPAPNSNTVWSNTLKTYQFANGKFVFFLMSSNAAGLTRIYSLTNYFTNSYFIYSNPSPPYIAGTSALLDGVVSPSANINGIYFAISNGAPWNKVSNIGGYWFTNLNTTNYSNGIYNFQFMFTYASGYSNSNFYTNITIDNTPPEIYLIQPAANEIIKNTYTFTAEIISNNIMISNTHLKIFDSSGTEAALIQGTLTAGKAVFTFNTTVLSHGEYYAIPFATNIYGVWSTTSNSVSFKIIQTPDNMSVEKAAAFPNPYKASSGSPMYFLNIPENADLIRIYTVSGILLKEIEISGSLNTGQIGGAYGIRIEWDVKDDQGRDLSAGIYFYEVKMNDQRKIGKFAIIR